MDPLEERIRYLLRNLDPNAMAVTLVRIGGAFAAHRGDDPLTTWLMPEARRDALVRDEKFEADKG